jgi:F0F1-type ATP synthase membrane subunit b/b'
MTEHGAAPASVRDLFWPALNFTLFVALLVRSLRGPVREYFRARTERLREALAAGAQALRDAASLRSALARDVANLPAQCERLRADVRAVAERERAALLTVAREAAERIRTDARLLAEYEFAAARRVLRAELVEETVRQAAALLRGAVLPDDQQRLVREFVTGAGAS